MVPPGFGTITDERGTITETVEDEVEGIIEDEEEEEEEEEGAEAGTVLEVEVGIGNPFE